MYLENQNDYFTPRFREIQQFADFDGRGIMYLENQNDYFTPRFREIQQFADFDGCCCAVLPLVEV